MDPQKIQSTFFNQIESHAIKFTNELLRKHKQNLDSYTQLFKNFSNSIKKTDKTSFIENWTKLGHNLENLMEWVNSLDCGLDKNNTEDIFKQYQARLELVNDQVPAIIQIQLLSESLKKQSKEPIVLKIWKNFQKLKTGFINNFVSVFNLIRKVFRKSYLKPFTGERRFRFFPFYSLYLEAPYYHYLQSRQNTLLQIIF